MCVHDTSSGLRGFLCREAGGATVEFVILVPLLIALLVFMAGASLQFATAGDVQQLAHELARIALPIAGEPDWCAQLRGHWVSPLASNLPMLEEHRVTRVQCMYDTGLGLARVQVIYDARGTVGSILGGLFGLDAESFVRDSYVQA